MCYTRRLEAACSRMQSCFLPTLHRCRVYPARMPEGSEALSMISRRFLLSFPSNTSPARDELTTQASEGNTSKKPWSVR